jgi:hypothetical protein
MWRRLKARLHPDAGGSEALFVFAAAVEESLGEVAGRSCSDCRRGYRREEPEPHIVHEDGRVPFPASVDFAALTTRALEVAEEVGGLFTVPLKQLRDCHAMAHLAHEQTRGASYKQLAAIGHIVGMTKRERGEWYRLAESIPLSQRHAGHIIAAAKKAGAA